MGNFKLTIFSKFIIILGLIVVIPFIILCFYAEPSLDDYSYAVAPTGLSSFLDIQLYNYLNWGSRYTATGILINNPIAYNWFFGYKLIALFMLLGFFAAMFYTFHTFTKNSKLSLVLSFSFMLIYLFMLPHIYSAFYWLPGSATYHLANILTLLLISHLYKESTTSSLFYKISVFILIFLIVGCNEISMLFIDILIFILFIMFYFKNKKVNYFYLSVLLWAGILTLFILLAPGNKVRANSIEVYNLPLLSILSMSIRKTLIIIVRYGIITFLINFIIFYNLRNSLTQIKFSFLNQYPAILYVILFIATITVFNFPSLWSLGIYAPLRALNISFFVLIIFSIIINYKIVISNFIQYHFKVSQLTSAIILLLLIFSYTFGINKKNYFELHNNLYNASSDLLTGKAMKFHTEMENRYSIIENSKKDTVYVLPLSVLPATIVTKDLSLDPGYFYNISMAKFFNKKAILLKNE